MAVEAVAKDGVEQQAEKDAMSAAARRRQLARVGRRELLLHDGASFLVLSLIALALYGVTLFLFRSFEAHREDLGREYAATGRAKLNAREYTAAVSALRVALSYQPDDRSDQLMLAQALAGSGKTDEASNYFLALREEQEGNGFINLQLARIARSKGEVSDALEYYGDSIVGDWKADGILRRREVRLELAQYLIEQKRMDEARTEILTAERNAPESPAMELLFADRLIEAGDLQDALLAERKAVQQQPHDRAALAAAGRTSFALGMYPAARELLRRALAEKGGPSAKALSDGDALAEMERQATRLEELSMSRELPARVRADHLRLAATVAEARLQACAPAAKSSATGTVTGTAAVKQGPVAAIAPAAASAGTTGAAAASSSKAPAAVTPLLALEGRWQSALEPKAMQQMRTDAESQDAMQQLIFDTERAFADPAHPAGTGIGSSTCGSPTGDDALLLKLAERYAAMNAAEGGTQ